MKQWLSSLLTVFSRESLIKFFVIIIKQFFFINIKYILLFRSKRVARRIDATVISMIAQSLCKDDLIIGQITVVDVGGKDDADALH